jgi:hypothetical protein
MKQHLAMSMLSISDIWIKYCINPHALIRFVASASYASAIRSLSIEINDHVVFKALFNAGLSPQEAEVWIARELFGATTYDLSNRFQISETVANQAYRRARTKAAYLGISRESMLALSKAMQM